MRVLRANYHRLEPERSKKSTIYANEVKASEPQGAAWKVTISRLHEISVCMPSAGAHPESAMTRILPSYSLSARR
jgi:hypothetical protein